MKKLLLIIGLFAGLCINAAAQDIIRTKDGRSIEAKIVSVNDASLTYKRFNNPNGPTFSMALNQIESIQYENGTGDVYAGRTTTYYSEKKYKELKGLYTKRDYNKTTGQPYSPLLAGVASYIIPGLGQLYAGEGGRGALVFLGGCAMGIGTGVAYYKHVMDMEEWLESQGHSLQEQDIDTDALDYSTYPVGSMLKIFAWVGLGAIYNIWNICDAVKVAKVKDAYWQDCHGYSAVTLSMDPYFAYTPVPGSGLQPVTGLSLKLTF